MTLFNNFCAICCLTLVPQAVHWLTSADAMRHCADRGFANTITTPSGVLCFSRTTAGSEAVYICDDGFHQNGTATRACQRDGVWNGSTPQCLPDPGGQDGTYNIMCLFIARTKLQLMFCICMHFSKQTKGLVQLFKQEQKSSSPQPNCSLWPAFCLIVLSLLKIAHL